MEPDKQHRSLSVSLLRILGFVTLFILGAHLLLQYLNLEVFYQQNGFIYELSNRFDLDDEASLSTWFSQALFLAIGLGAAIAAYLSRETAIRRIWQFIAIIGLVISIDEVASLHEFVLQSLHNLFYKDTAPTILNNAWLLVTPLILAAVLWFVWKIARLLPRRTITLFVGAIFTFLIGAVFVDAIASVADRESFLNQGVLIAIEETLELLGNVVVLYAIADYIETHHGHKVMSALSRLR